MLGLGRRVSGMQWISCSIVLLSLLSNQAFAFVDASALSATSAVPNQDLAVSPDDIEQADAYTPPADNAANPPDDGSGSSGDASGGSATPSGSKVSAPAVFEATDKVYMDNGYTQITKNQQKITGNQKSMTSNQQSLINNQVMMGQNQITLSNNQQTMSNDSATYANDILTALQALIQPDQMRDLLNGSKCADPDNCTDEDKDFLYYLEQVLGGVVTTPPTLQPTSVSQAFLASLQSQSVTNAYAAGMVDEINQVMSGAGNPTGTDNFSVSNVLSGVQDPVAQTTTDFNAAIYPVVAPVDNNPGDFQAALCRSPSYFNDQMTFACNMYIALSYSGLLVNSCISDWSSANASGSSNQSGVASSASSSTGSTSSTGPQFAGSSYPDDSVNGCTSEKYTDSSNASWNGWLASSSSISNSYGAAVSKTGTGQTGVMAFCNAVLQDPTVLAASDSDYVDLANQVASDCQSLLDALNANSAYYYSQDFANIASNGLPMLQDTKTQYINLGKDVKTLLIWQIYAYNSQPSVSNIPQGYPSMWTLLGQSDYSVDTSSTTSTTSSSDGSSTSSSEDYLTTVMNNCVGSLANNLSGSTVTVTTPAQSDTAKLAQFYTSMITNSSPITVNIPVPNLSSVNTDLGASATFVANGRWYAMDSTGTALANSDGDDATTVTLDTNGMSVTDIANNQSQMYNAISTFSQSYTNAVNPLLSQKLLGQSVLNQMYSDRNMQISLSGSGSDQCLLTPATIRRMASTWRLDPNYEFCSDTSDGSTDCSNKGSYVEHIASANSNEVIQELALLLSELNSHDAALHQQNSILMMLTALQLNQKVDEGLNKLSNQSKVVQSLLNAYATGSIPNTTPMPTG